MKAFTNLETLAQTVHQENLKYEAKLLSMKHDLADAKKDVSVLEKENEVRLAQLHEATSGNMLRFVRRFRKFVSTNSLNLCSPLLLLE